MFIPWQQRKELGIVRSFILTSLELLKNPVHFFDTLQTSESRGGEILFASISYTIGFLINFAYMFILRQEPLISKGKLLISFPLILLFTILLINVIALIMHSFLTIITSQHYSFEKTLQVALYTFGASQLFQIIPFFGSFIGTFFMVIFIILGLTTIHKIKYYQSVTVTVLPFILLSVLFLYMWTLVKDQFQI